MKFKNKILLGLFMLPFAALAVACGAKHNISSKWKMNAEEHWHECIDEGCEEVFDKGAHDFDETTVSVTCTEDGYIKKTCKVCNYSFRETTSEHEGHDIAKHDAKAAQCELAGNIEYYECTKCHEYYSDMYAEHVLTDNSWVIPATGHTLNHFAAKPATIYENGYIDHYECSVCEKYFADAEGKVELTEEQVIVDQLVSSVAEARASDIGTTLKVRGVVVGVFSTGASAGDMQVALVVKDENNNTMMPLTGGSSDTNKLAGALGKKGDLHLPYAVGTIIEMPITVKKTTATYACGNACVHYMLFNDTTGEELSAYSVGQGSAKFDLTDPNIPVVKEQSDFWKFLGLPGGTNVCESPAEYSAEISGANTFKLVKLENIEAVCQSDPTTVTENNLNWRPMFDETVNTWAKSAISNSANATNKIGAHQSYYPVFYNYNTWFNVGKSFSELVFGDAAKNPVKNAWANHVTGSNDCYAVFCGGNDYYAQFVIFDADWVVARTK